MSPSSRYARRRRAVLWLRRLGAALIFTAVAAALVTVAAAGMFAMLNEPPHP